jgi:hypothetical protein
LDFSKLSDRERLIAEQAVETLRALDKAADDAPWGNGLACMEACIHDKGFDLLRSLMTQTAAAQPEAKKRGLFPPVFLRQRCQVQVVPGTHDLDDSGASFHPAASLSLPAMHFGHDPAGRLGRRGASVDHRRRTANADAGGDELVV